MADARNPETETNGGSALKEQIQATYSAAARAVRENAGASCCGAGQSCCGDTTDQITSGLYQLEEVSDLPETVVQASLGCGNPTALAEIFPGETVLDLGSGGGIDVLLSARRVGPTGKAYGLDMTDEMLALARENQAKAGVTNVEFLKGEIEAIPLPDQSVDLIISNCVINLSGEKDRVLREAFRTLRPGGRFAVSDVVFRGEMSLIPDELSRSAAAWAGCVAGALEERDYIARLEQAGFVDATVTITRVYNTPGMLPPGVELASGFIRARRPEAGL